MKRITVVVFAVLAAAAWASNIPRAHKNTGSATQIYCAAAAGRPLAVSCDLPVRLATGVLLSDGGNARTSDAGAPMVADTNDELVSFPGDPYKVDLGASESCVALISEQADGGTNNCNFLERNAAP